MIKEEIEAVVCKKCGKLPETKKILDCWYTYDREKKCKKWDKYEFCGMTKESSIRQWNSANTNEKRDRIQHNA